MKTYKTTALVLMDDLGALKIALRMSKKARHEFHYRDGDILLHLGKQPKDVFEITILDIEAEVTEA